MNWIKLIFRKIKIYKIFNSSNYIFIILGVLVIGSLSSMFVLEAKYKEVSKKVNNNENFIKNKDSNDSRKDQILPTASKENMPSNIVPSSLTITPIISRSGSGRIPNPPSGGVSWPAEGETINSSEEKLCFVDAGTGGDLSGVMRRKNINNGGWETYIPVYPSSSTCFNPKEGANTFSIQLKNSYREESPVYTRNFIFHKQAPTSAPVGDTTPPIIDQLEGPSDGSVVTNDSFCFKAHVTDNVSNYPNLWIRYKFSGGEWNAWMTDMSACFSTRGNNQSIAFSVQAKDEAGNESGATTRTFTVNITTP